MQDQKRIERIEHVQLYRCYAKVYNFEVKELPCYAVGHSVVHVHNGNGPGNIIGAAPTRAAGVGAKGFESTVMDVGKGIPAPNSVSARKIYRGMTEGPDGLPQTGPTARQLGVRPGQDIPVTGGQVSPNTGRMSVAPDTPGNLPSHRRPPSLDGTGKDPVWELDINDLGGGLNFRQDSPKHGFLKARSIMSIDEFQQALAAWRVLEKIMSINENKLSSFASRIFDGDPLPKLIAEMRGLRDAGISSHDGLLFLDNLRANCPDDHKEYVVLELMDIVTGFCS